MSDGLAISLKGLSQSDAVSLPVNSISDCFYTLLSFISWRLPWGWKHNLHIPADPDLDRDNYIPIISVLGNTLGALFALIHA